MRICASLYNIYFVLSDHPNGGAKLLAFGNEVAKEWGLRQCSSLIEATRASAILWSERRSPLFFPFEEPSQGSSPSIRNSHGLVPRGPYFCSSESADGSRRSRWAWLESWEMLGETGKFWSTVLLGGIIRSIILGSERRKLINAYIPKPIPFVWHNTL